MGRTWDARAEHFARELGSVLRVDDEQLASVGPATDLFDEWGLDSLQAFEMIIVVAIVMGLYALLIRRTARWLQ